MVTRSGPPPTPLGETLGTVSRQEKAPPSSSSASEGGKVKVNFKAEAKSSGGKSKSKRGSTSSRASRSVVTSSESCSGGEGGFHQGLGLGAALGGRGRGSSASALAAAVAAAGVVPSPHRVYYVVDPKEVMVNKNAFMCPFLARWDPTPCNETVNASPPPGTIRIYASKRYM